ncbi:hypothetical protein MCETHM1_03286 [Flavobacteriaceae bacterium]
MTFTKEFKEAIKNLPSAEKDKLIFRLLKHDLDLANRLLFELVSTESVEDRRNKMQDEVTKEIKRTSKRFFSFGYILMDMRYLSGSITEHVRITKDKYGEISLNLQMLNEALALNKLHLLNSKPKDAYTFCIYVIARTFKIMILINALHEDYFMEFRNDLEKLGNHISETPLLMRTAVNNGLDVNWILQCEIPENILVIHKEIRANGFLK